MCPLPNEIIRYIFQAATYVPYEFDTTGDEREAARAHLLGSGREITQPALKVAISTRLQISLTNHAWSRDWKRYLYQTIVISKVAHLKRILRVLKRNAELGNYIRRIDVYWVSLRGLHQLCSSCPNLQTLRIVSTGGSSLNWTSPRLECISLNMGITTWPALMHAQTLQTLDLVGSSGPAPPDFHDLPVLPNLYAVRVWLQDWHRFAQLWLVNGERIRILSIDWEVRHMHEGDGQWPKIHWDQVILNAHPESGYLRNVTDLITSQVPPFGVSMVFPSLKVMEVRHRGDAVNLHKVNPYGECLWKWSNPPRCIRISGIPTSHLDDRWLGDYHLSLARFIQPHINQFTKGIFFSAEFFCSRGSRIRYKDLGDLWQSFGGEFINVLLPSIAI